MVGINVRELIVFGVPFLGVGILMCFALGKVFIKASKPGWACIVPVYNLWVMVQICGKRPLWFVLGLIPIVNLVPALALPFWLARSFGKDSAFGVGLLLVPAIFLPILGFG